MFLLRLLSFFLSLNALVPYMHPHKRTDTAVLPLLMARCQASTSPVYLSASWFLGCGGRNLPGALGYRGLGDREVAYSPSSVKSSLPGISQSLWPKLRSRSQSSLVACSRWLSEAFLPTLTDLFFLQKITPAGRPTSRANWSWCLGASLLSRSTSR